MWIHERRAAEISLRVRARNTRTQQSVYWENKFDYGPSVTDVSLRYYTDSWGLKAETAELSERINLTHWLYVEPDLRCYRQTSAAISTTISVNGQAIPTYASSDFRLGNIDGADLCGARSAWT